MLARTRCLLTPIDRTRGTIRDDSDTAVDTMYILVQARDAMGDRRPSDSSD